MSQLTKKYGNIARDNVDNDDDGAGGDDVDSLCLVEIKDLRRWLLPVEDCLIIFSINGNFSLIF